MRPKRRWCSELNISGATTIESFDDLVRAACNEPKPAVLLTCVLRSEVLMASSGSGAETPLKGEGVLRPVMVKGFAIGAGLDFEQLRTEAEQAWPDWAFIMLAMLPGSSDKPLPAGRYRLAFPLPRVGVQCSADKGATTLPPGCRLRRKWQMHRHSQNRRHGEDDTDAGARVQDRTHAAVHLAPDQRLHGSREGGLHAASTDSAGKG